MTLIKRFLFIVGCVFFLAPRGVLAAGWTAGDWIDGETEMTTPAWQDQLGIDWTRISCKVSVRNTPQSCITFIENSPAPGISQYFIYMPVDNTWSLLDNALLFSSLSKGNSAIAEAGIDDFFYSYQTWYHQMSNASQFLNQLIDNLKSSNPNLKFGITLYEDELDSIQNVYMDSTHLPPAVKAKFDYIHLFLHYRANAPKFAQYVSQAQSLFPNAKIIAGVYSYDRIDYFPCAQNDSTKAPCTQQQELNFFQQALNTQVQLLNKGSVIALELFPGYFGNETQLYGPHTDDLTCNNVTRCVNNTLTMRGMILAAYTGFHGTAPVIVTQPTNASLLVGQTEKFAMTAAGASPLAYQWLRNGVAVPGAHAPTFQIGPVTLNDDLSSFACTVSNSLGSVTSQTVTLTVANSASVPSIVVQPANANLLVGQTSTLWLSAAGSPPPTYTWKKNGIAIIGAATSTYTTPPAALMDNQSKYTCFVSNAYGGVTTQPAVLTVSAEAQTATPVTVGGMGGVRLFPNPWRKDRHNGQPILFENLATTGDLKVFTVSGHHVKTLTVTGGVATWDLTNESGDDVAAGLYIYLATDVQGNKVQGKLAIVH